MKTPGTQLECLSEGPDSARCRFIIKTTLMAQLNNLVVLQEAS